MNQRRNIKILFIITLVLLIPLFLNPFLTVINSLQRGKELGNLQSAGVEYLNFTFENPTFDGVGTPWTSDIDGDTRDGIGYIDQNQANYELIGDAREITIDEPLNETDWTPYKNQDLPIYPDRYEINSSGCHVSHTWHENVNQTRNRPSVHWKRTITMPVDMRDYIITSAFIEAEFNATVTVSPTSGGIERRVTETVSSRFSTGDYAEFYVLISDADEEFPPIQVAYNHTADLGRDTPALGSYPDTLMTTIPQEVLKDVLTSVFEHDGYNFTITLGIDIYCEDNIPAVDIDIWDALIIRSFNLSFSYEKKINQFTTISWEQVGNEITGSNYQITKANLTFNYKTDRVWPSASSPNSEFRVLINDNPVLETINLDTALTTFRPAKIGGFDVTSLILKDVNISLSIQLFLADEFTLDQNITLSIDDVYFTIFYIRIDTDIFSEPWFFTALLVFAIIITAITGAYLIAYQKILKYPRAVRKVRKFKRSLNRKNMPQVVIIPRDVGFNKLYNRELAESSKLLKIKEVGLKEPTSIISGTPKKPIVSKEFKMDSDELIDKSLEKKSELDRLVKEADKK
jgi:hypothetical protein